MTSMNQTINSQNANASRKVFAIDFDDVMAQTVGKEIILMKEIYGIDLTIDDYESYKLFQNGGWGTPLETREKLAAIERHSLVKEPCEGLVAAIKRLRELGFEIHVVTSSSSTKSSMIQWLEDLGLSLGPDMDIEAFHRTADVDAGDLSKEANAMVKKTDDPVKRSIEEENRYLVERGAKRWRENVTPLRKMEILKAIGADIFVDDQHQNLSPTLENNPDCFCLLFGEYKWNRNNMDYSHSYDFMTWDEKQAAGVQTLYRPLPIEGHPRMSRVKNWDGVIEWVEKNDKGDWKEARYS